MIKKIYVFKHVPKNIRYLLCSNSSNSDPHQPKAEINSKYFIDQYDEQIRNIRLMKDEQEKIEATKRVGEELKKNLNQLKQEAKLEKIRQYLTEGLDKQKKNEEERKVRNKSGQMFLPNGLILKKLQFGDRRVLLAGVQEEDEDHSIFVKRTAEKFDSEIILTALPPDMPYFIKTQLPFAQEWRKFIRDSNYAKNEAKFYLSPRPFLPEEACLNRAHIQLVRNNLNISKNFNQITYAILQYHHLTKKYHPNTLLTPLLVSSVKKIFFCDFPLIKQREMWAMTIPLPKLREIFKIYKEAVINQKKAFFDPRILFPKPVLSKKFQNMANQVKLASLQSAKTSVFICPAQYTEHFLEEWKLSTPLRHQNDFKFTEMVQPNIMFIEFVEKLVILDLMLEPIINKYYIENESFPFTGHGIIGGGQHMGKIFIVWKHFYTLYNRSLVPDEEKSNMVHNPGQLENH